MTGHFTEIARSVCIDPEVADFIYSEASEASRAISDGIGILGITQEIIFARSTLIRPPTGTAERLGCLFANLADLQCALEHIKRSAKELH